jgi:Protein of unknown function (DUF2911)
LLQLAIRQSAFPSKRSFSSNQFRGRFPENNSEGEGSSMLKHFVVALVAIAGLSLGNPFCHAQSALLDLPRDSQHSVVTQRIGITDITINYHRPLVKGRTIWGKVVPYNEVWRTGAAGEGRLCSLHDSRRKSVDDYFLQRPHRVGQLHLQGG